MRSILLTLVLVALAAPALASEGVAEINQTCAVQTGCFPGDAAGFPVTITGASGRSYRLTSDLSIGDANLDVILISANDITLNLGGFRILCSIFTPPATIAFCGDTPGTGVGVNVSSTTLTGLEVKNGSIAGMGMHGVSLGRQSVATGLRVSEAGVDGINVGLNSTVTNSKAYENGNDGIEGLNGCLIAGNTAIANGQGNQTDSGIRCQNGCAVSGNLVRQNAGFGLNLIGTTSYRDNTVTGNTVGGVLGGFNAGNNFCEGIGTASVDCP